MDNKQTMSRRNWISSKKNEKGAYAANQVSTSGKKKRGCEQGRFFARE